MLGAPATRTMPARSLRLLAAAAVGGAVAHVPTYTDGCDYNCCHPPHVHTTSQAVYLKDSGGLELDVADLTTTGDGEVIDFDVVFKKEYDLSTFEVYVGCGGCASGTEPGSGEASPDPLLVPPLAKPAAYQPGKLEPFTQTGYFPLLPKGEGRQYDTRRLAGCASDHWSIRLVTYDNATETIVWGAVVGCEGMECERFTPEELLSFPIYVLRNHGPAWNDRADTLPLLIVVVLLGMVFVLGYFCGGWLVLCRPVGAMPRIVEEAEELNRRADAIDRGVAHRDPLPFQNTNRWVALKDVEWRFSIRCVLYALATWALFVDLLETLVHFGIAASAVGMSDGKGYRWFAFLLGVGKVAPIVLVALIWAWHREIPEQAWRRFRCCCPESCCTWYDGLGFYSPLWAHGIWSTVEVPFVGLAGFVWFGAGFFVFPIAVTLAGAYRFYHWCRNPDRLGTAGGSVTPEGLASYAGVPPGEKEAEQVEEEGEKIQIEVTQATVALPALFLVR